MSDTQYIVSARKYRPATFKSVVGQKTLTETLKNAIDSRRLAQAYLFCGPRGVGKTSCARIFAKTINCLSPTPEGEACGVCESCRALEDGNSFNIIELDAASNNSVDDIRNITEQVNVPPTIGKYRVFIIDEVHMLSSAAFNAFLKTLEEPPAYVIFILATTEKHKVIPTILSRCQIYDFKRITIQDMVEHLQYVASCEGISADVESLNVIARKADGAMRDALSIFDQVAASSFGNITYESTVASLNVLDYEFYFRLVDTFRQGDVPQALLIYKQIRDRGFDSLFFINGLASHVRDLMVGYTSVTASLLEVADDVALRYKEQAKTLPVEWYYAALRILSDCDLNYRTASSKQLLVELALIRLCQLLKPATPPFDRVDSDLIPLRDPATPHIGAPSAPIVAPSSAATPAPAAAPPRPANTAPADQPAPSPTTKAAPAPEETASRAPEHRKTVRGHRVASAAGKTDATGAIPSAGTAQYERLREPVQPDAFAQAWTRYLNNNPDRQILVSAMRKGIPEQTDPETFHMTVDHPAVRQAFESAMTDLLSFLRAELRNDYITLRVEIDPTKSEDKHIPPKELLQEIVEQNPLMAAFINDIEGEMS